MRVLEPSGVATRKKLRPVQIWRVYQYVCSLLGLGKKAYVAPRRGYRFTFGGGIFDGDGAVPFAVGRDFLDCHICWH